MRKLFSLIAAVLFAGSMMATTVTKTVEELATANSWENGVVVTPFALDEVISVSTEATDANTGKYYTSGQQIRLYQTGSAKMTISAAEGYTISSITVEYVSEKGGIFAETASGVAVAYENVQSATFTVANSGEATNGQARVTAISVTYNGEGGGVTPPAVATPVISGEVEFTESVIVTITCSTPEADIYYTTDGTTDPKCDCSAAPEYTQQIVLTETTTIMAAAYTGNDWSAVATKTFTKVEAPAAPVNLGEKTIAEFLELKNTKDTCILTGIVSNITNTTYGNFDLVELNNAEVSVYVYGLLNAAGESKKFAELGVAEGDTLKVLAIYNEYNNNPQAKNAIFVEVKKSSVPVVEPEYLGHKTIAEFLEMKNTKDTCELTGVVYNIYNTTYGNLYLIEGTDTLNIYGVLNAAGENKKFAELNVAENDTLTVKAIYSEYQGNPQVKNAIFVEVKKAAVEPVEPIVLDFSNAFAYVDNTYFEEYRSTDIVFTTIPMNEEYELVGDGDFLQIEVYPENPNDITGLYTIEDENLDNYYTYLMRVNGTDTAAIDFVDGTVAIEVLAVDTENKLAQLSLNANLLGNDENMYVVEGTFVLFYDFIAEPSEAVENTEAAAKVIKRIEMGNVVIYKNGVKYSVNGQIVK